MKLSNIQPGVPLVGLEPELVCTVVAVSPLAADTVQVFYRLPDGTLKERLLGPDDVVCIEAATAARPWAFDGDGAAFQLACEAKRIDLAFLFDPMMAVHTSNVDPLPHQITAVYESLLPRQPLRFVLADDPGAGKTIMAGLYIRELFMRADARRVLIIAPGAWSKTSGVTNCSRSSAWSSRSTREPSTMARRAAIRSKTTTSSSFASISSPATRKRRAQTTASQGRFSQSCCRRLGLGRL
jgi:hypothetical protein